MFLLTDPDREGLRARSSPDPFRLRFPPSNKVPRPIWALQKEERKRHKKAEVKSFFIREGFKVGSNKEIAHLQISWINFLYCIIFK
jgi:hypothetical protein